MEARTWKKHVWKRVCAFFMAFALLLTLNGWSQIQTASAKSAKKKAMKISTKSVKLKVGQSKTVKVKNLPKKAKVTWKSSDKKVAAVSKKGKIKAQKAGSAKVTAKVSYKKGKKKATKKFTVKVKVTGQVVAKPTASPKPTAVPTIDPEEQRHRVNLTDKGSLSDSNLTKEHLSANGIKTKDNGLMRTNLSTLDMINLDGMGLGWNLGNQLEETNWYNTHETVEECENNANNPTATQLTFSGIKSYGVKTVRVPVAWSNFMTMVLTNDDGTTEEIKGATEMYKAIDEGKTNEKTYYRVSEDLMKRIEEVVNYALNEEMYIIFNIHWDGGWWGMFGAEEWDGTPLTQTDIKKNPIRYQAVKKYKDIWEQLSYRFMEYSDRLIFEGANEEISGRLNDDYRDPAKAQDNQTGKLGEDGDQIYAMGAQINQLFVDTVRASGGNNAYRHLLIPGTGNESCVISGYGGDHYKNNGTIDERFIIPTDPAEKLTGKKKLSISVHYYDPIPYALSPTSTAPYGYDADWGTEEDKKEMSEIMDRLKKFTDQGYGVIMGETGPVKAYKDGVPEFLTELFTQSMQRGLCPVMWDEGGYYNREKGYFYYEDVGKAFATVTGATPDYSLNKEPLFTGIITVPSEEVDEKQGPLVVATWEGEFMRHTGEQTASELEISRPDDFDPVNHGIYKLGSISDNLKIIDDPMYWNITFGLFNKAGELDWASIEKPCVKVTTADDAVSSNLDLQLGYWSLYTAEDKQVINGKKKVGDLKKFEFDVDYDPGTGSFWQGKYIPLDRKLLTTDHPWLWVTTNTYTGASILKVEICDAAYNADGTKYVPAAEE